MGEFGPQLNVTRTVPDPMRRVYKTTAQVAMQDLANLRVGRNQTVLQNPVNLLVSTPVTYSLVCSHYNALRPPLMSPAALFLIVALSFPHHCFFFSLLLLLSSVLFVPKGVVLQPLAVPDLRLP